MLRRLIALLLFVTIGFVAGMVITGRMRSAGEAGAGQPQAAPAPQGRPSVSGPQALPDLTSIAERAVNAVTSITSTSTIRSPFANDPLYRFFYGDQMMEQQAQSLGSGVIVSRDGYVLTNFHVIDSGGSRPEVSVILADKREFAAKIIGLDPETDLAVLKINANNLPTIGWGDSSRLRVAEWVLAIGNPFGVFSQTVTLGIVSATSRSVEGLSYEDFIQTDAAINRGNSGGALINARGELVGINTAIYSETGGYQGIGLAVPSNLARRMMDVMVKDGVVRRGTIYGIQLAAMTSQIAEELAAPDTSGVVVTAVDRRSRAAASGLERLDIIIALNGRTIETAQQFLKMLGETEIGSTATLTVLRQGRRVPLRVPIEEAQPRRRR
jgi:Do/DeqQ family serine protease